MGRESRAVWAKRVERWSDSGLTAKQFAAEVGVSAQSLSFWKWKLRKDGVLSVRASRLGREKSQPPLPSTGSFLQLVPAPGSTRTGNPLELVLGKGLTVRVSAGFDETTLMRLVAMFGGG